MRRMLVMSLGVVVLALLIAGQVSASRCGKQNPPRCGPDAQTDPPNPALGGIGGCTEASLTASPLFKRSGMCAPGQTMVIYDVGSPFPDNGMPQDAQVVGATSFITLRASDTAPCAHMVDTVDPKPCPDPQLCPDPMAGQPQATIKAPVSGYIVACWTPPDTNGCRDVRFYTESVCLHVGHEELGPGCTVDRDVDCPHVSTEQIAIDNPGGTNHRLCPPTDPVNSCRGTRPAGQPGFRFRIGGFCATNNCLHPGTMPDVDPQKSCTVAWGESNLGYGVSSRGINAPGWYDWKTGAFKLDVSSAKPSCGDLGICLGSAGGLHARTFWDLRIVGVPRPGQKLPCADGPCTSGQCF